MAEWTGVVSAAIAKYIKGFEDETLRNRKPARPVAGHARAMKEVPLEVMLDLARRIPDDQHPVFFAECGKFRGYGGLVRAKASVCEDWKWPQDRTQDGGHNDWRPFTPAELERWQQAMVLAAGDKA